MTTPLTLTDYDEAIQNLTDARNQIDAADELWRGCAYCGSEEHQPNECPHNPLVLARRVNERPALWRCYHCCVTFSDQDVVAARAHFGLTSAAMPACVADALKAAGVKFSVVTDEDGDEALWFRLAKQPDEEAVDV